jgi:hypothetical protein
MIFYTHTYSLSLPFSVSLSLLLWQRLREYTVGSRHIEMYDKALLQEGSAETFPNPCEELCRMSQVPS